MLCNHYKLLNLFKSYNFVDNDDGHAYKTILVGRSADEGTEMVFNETNNVTTRYLATARIHMDR